MTSPYLGCEPGPNLPVGQAPFAFGWEGAAFVDACEHQVWEHVLAQPDSTGVGNEVVVRCRACHAPRCGHSTDEDPCMRLRHHGDTVVMKSRRADLVYELDKRSHVPYSEWLASRLPASLNREDIEQWLSE